MTVVCYDKPQGAPDSRWQVYAGLKPTWTHHTSRGATATISSDGSDPVALLLVAPQPVTAVDVAAEQPGVWPPPQLQAVAYGSIVAVVVPPGFNGNLLVKINDADPPDWQKWCSVGVLPLEAVNPDQGATHYFGPGIHTGGPLALKSGDSVYVAGGAYVNRRLVAGEFTGQPHQVDGVRISGRGVIDTSNGYGPDDQGLGTMDLVGVDNLTIEGITYVSRFGWGIAAYLCSNVVGDWLRLYSCEIPDAADYGGQGTPDGWDFIGCSDVELRRSLLSASDDSSAIKGDKYGQTGDTSAVAYEDLLLMQGGKSNGMEIGYEGGTTTITGVTYRRIVEAVCWRDDEPYRTAPIGVHVPSKATVDQVLYEDIDIREIDGKDYALFIGSWYMSALSYSEPGDENRGTIGAVTFRRVHWPATDKVGRIVSEGETAGPIVFEDCTWGGQPLTEPPEGWEIVNADVTFTTGDPDPPPPDDELEARVAQLELQIADLRDINTMVAVHLRAAADALSS